MQDLTKYLFKIVKAKNVFGIQQIADKKHYLSVYVSYTSLFSANNTVANLDNVGYAVIPI